jgi:DNA-binding SARP family transcriptional activator
VTDRGGYGGWSEVEFRLLGPVEVWSAGRLLDAGQPGQRRVPAVLLLEARRLVTFETLVDRLWAERPPDRARSALYSYATRIRRLLAAAAAAERAGGDRQPRLLRRSGG